MSTLTIEGVGRTFPGVRGGAPTVALQPITLAVQDNDFITLIPKTLTSFVRSTLYGAEGLDSCFSVAVNSASGEM